MTEVSSKNVTSSTFFEHLDELRVCLTRSLIALIIAAVCFYPFIDQVLHYIIRPVGKLVFTSPADAFVTRMMLTLMGGFFIALPYIFYHIWSFVASGLKDTERRYIIVYGPLSFLLFILGSVFAYFIMIPISLKFLLSFSSEILTPMITIKNYISFLGTMVLAFGIVFELPIIMLFLTKIGIATPEFLMQKRKHAIVLILIVSAIITPPDFITQILIAGPLIILYEIGVIVSKWTYKRPLDE